MLLALACSSPACLRQPACGRLFISAVCLLSTSTPAGSQRPGRSHLPKPCLQVCDTVSDLASSLMTEQGGWNELLPFMMTCIQSQNARLMEMALLVFANLGDVVSQLAAYLPTLHDVSCSYAHMARVCRMQLLGESVCATFLGSLHKLMAGMQSCFARSSLGLLIRLLASRAGITSNCLQKRSRCMSTPCCCVHPESSLAPLHPRPPAGLQAHSAAPVRRCAGGSLEGCNHLHP